MKGGEQLEEYKKLVPILVELKNSAGYQWLMTQIQTEISSLVGRLSQSDLPDSQRSYGCGNLATLLNMTKYVDSHLENAVELSKNFKDEENEDG